jgi:hypothetical protein
MATGSIESCARRSPCDQLGFRGFVFESISSRFIRRAHRLVQHWCPVVGVAGRGTAAQDLVGVRPYALQVREHIRVIRGHHPWTSSDRCPSMWTRRFSPSAKKTKVLLEKPHARDGKDRTGEQRQALGSEFEFGSQATDGTSSINAAPTGLSSRGDYAAFSCNSCGYTRAVAAGEWHWPCATANPRLASATRKKTAIPRRGSCGRGSCGRRST